MVVEDSAAVEVAEGAALVVAGIRTAMVEVVADAIKLALRVSLYHLSSATSVLHLFHRVPLHRAVAITLSIRFLSRASHIKQLKTTYGWNTTRSARKIMETRM